MYGRFSGTKKIGCNNEETVKGGGGDSTIYNLYVEHLANYLFVISPTLSEELLLRHLRPNETRLMNTLSRLTTPSLTVASLFHVTFQYFCLSIILKRALLDYRRLQALSAVKESTANVVKSICLSRDTFQNFYLSKLPKSFRFSFIFQRQCKKYTGKTGAG